MRCEVTIDDSLVRGEWEFQNDDQPTHRIFLDSARTNPVHFATALNALERMQRNPQNASATISVKLPYTPWKARVALLRMAYLMMFRQFGYSFALHPSSKLLLDQIWNPEAHLIPDAFSVRMTDYSHFNCVGLVTNPPERKSFCVLLKFKTSNRTLVQGIMIPCHDDPEGTVYRRFEADWKSGDRFTGKLRIIPYKQTWLPHANYVDYFFGASNEKWLDRFIENLRR